MKKPLGTHDIARICHVTPPAVIQWLDNGKIPSFKTGGGHRRVWERDLVEFMKAHNMLIPPELAAAGKQRFLIVEDEPEIRRVMRKVFKLSFPEAEIDEAGDGFEAGHKIHSLLPSLVILDLLLPGVNGLKVCRMIRADKALRHVRILAVSGCDVEESRRRALEAGADDFLGKPFKVAEFTRRIEKLAAER